MIARSLSRAWGGARELPSAVSDAPRRGSRRRRLAHGASTADDHFHASPRQCVARGATLGAPLSLVLAEAARRLALTARGRERIWIAAPRRRAFRPGALLGVARQLALPVDGFVTQRWCRPGAGGTELRSWSSSACTTVPQPSSSATAVRLPPRSLVLARAATVAALPGMARSHQHGHGQTDALRRVARRRHRAAAVRCASPSGARCRWHKASPPPRSPALASASKCRSRVTSWRTQRSRCGAISRACCTSCAGGSALTLLVPRAWRFPGGARRWRNLPLRAREPAGRLRGSRDFAPRSDAAQPHRAVRLLRRLALSAEPALAELPARDAQADAPWLAPSHVLSRAGRCRRRRAHW